MGERRGLTSPHKICLVLSIILSTLSVKSGFGKHVSAIPAENLSAVVLKGNLCGSFSIMAAVLSKTSFAVTLLRVMEGRMYWLLWAIIVSMNIAMSLNALLVWC